MSRRSCEYVWRFLAENDCAGADNITNGMLCSICGVVLINAHRARCGCRFCADCVTRYLDGGRKFCPAKKDDCCSEELMEIDETVHPDHAMNQEISRLIVKCPRDGCRFKGELRKMDEHERVCQSQQSVKCPYCTVGCQESRLIDDKIGGHLVEESESHERLLMKYIAVLQGEIGSMKRDIATLTEQRREQQIVATQQAEQIAHLNREVRAVQDENQSMRQQIISLQLEIETNRRMQVGIVSRLSSLETAAGNLEQQKREKWLLQQDLRLDELEQQVANEKAERGRIIDEVRHENQARCDEVALRVRENWIKVENHTRGEFVWCIDQWAARRQAARDDPSDKAAIFSEPFCLHEHGYRMSLDAWPDGYHGDNDLHIVWCLMRGPFDDHLKWPFKGTVTVSVIDQQTRLAHTSWTVRSDQYPDDRRWEKPKSMYNDGFGDPGKKFINVDELSRNEAVCRDDRILIRCVVEMAD